MKRNEYVFAGILVVSSAMVVYGVALVATSAAWVAAGGLIATLGWLTLGDSK